MKLISIILASDALDPSKNCVLKDMACEPGGVVYVHKLDMSCPKVD